MKELKPLTHEYYGDNVRWFIATVVDASPPLGFEGRVKIRVHGLHSHETYLLPQQDLPWAQCVLPTTEGVKKGIGGFTGSRFVDLVAFSPSFRKFTKQLEFVAFELRGKKANANILLLQSDNIEGRNNLAEIVTKYYLENTQKGFAGEVEEKALEILESIGG